MINFKKHRFVEVGNCHITLNKDEFYIIGTINNLPFERKIATKEFVLLPFTPGKHFEIQDGQNIYRIILDNTSHVCKWILALKCFNKLHHIKKCTK